MELSQLELEQYIAERWLSGKMKSLADDWCSSENIVSTLFQMNKSEDPKLAWRSAYVIDLIHDVNPTIVEPYLENIANEVVKLNNQSIKRHYLRILTQHDISDLASGLLVDACFKWLTEEETPIAVKAHCMSILHNLCQTFPEMKPELKMVLENLLPYGSKGEVNRAKRILFELEKINQ